MEPLLSLKHVSKTFAVGKTILGKPDKFVHAVNDVSFDVYKGETFSIVGESGCGKSTTGRLINHLLTPDSGEIKFMGQEISHLTQDQMRPLRKDVQMIFQDPAGSLNPRMRVEDLIAEPLLIHTDMSKAERMEVVHELLGIVGLSPKHAKRYPHECSGSETAYRNRPGPDRKTEAHHRRRAHFRSGRFHPGPGAEPPPSSAGEIRSDLRFHFS